jgi:predicted nucleotidyltransferase
MERYDRDAAQRAAGRAAAMLGTDRRIRLVYVYGSTEDPDRKNVRDLDLAVLAQPPFSFDEILKLAADLACETGVRVDLVSLHDAPPTLRYEIITGGRCLFARDEREQAEFELNSLSRFLDFQPFRRVQQEYIRARVEERRGAEARSAS